MATVTIPSSEFDNLKEIEAKFNEMLKTWKPISEKSLKKKAEREAKDVENKAQKLAAKELKQAEKLAEKLAAKIYIPSEKLFEDEKELKEIKLQVSRVANGKHLAAVMAKRREDSQVPNFLEMDF